MTEIQRSFDSKASDAHIKLMKESKEKIKKEEEEETANEMNVAMIPNYQIIFEFDLLLLLKEMNDSLLINEALSESIEEKKENETVELPHSDEKRHSFLNTACQDLIIKNLESSGYDNENERILKDCMILQGGFNAILTALSKTTGEVQLELLSTLINLLAHNSKHKFEFKYCFLIFNIFFIFF